MQLEARLRAFAAVVREGSFSRAASALYVSQPAVSKHLSSLEAELGTRLVVRDRRGVQLTPGGRLLADHVLRAEALLANAQRALATAGDAEAGVVTVAASGIPADYLLPLMLPSFFERHPRVAVKVLPTTSRGALQHVRAHEAELGVVGGFATPDELESEPLLEDEIVLLGTPELARRRLRPADLRRLAWITRAEGSGTRAAVEATRLQLGIDEVRTIEAPTWEAVKTLAAAGAGVAAISRFAVKHELAAGALEILDVPRWQLHRTLRLVHTRDVPLTPAAALFREALRAFAFPGRRPAVDLDPSVVEQLRVFVSGFEADAAEYVCNLERSALEELAVRGVLLREGHRYRVRAEPAGAEPPAEIARRHAEFFALLGDDTADRLRHTHDEERTERLELERQDVEAAVRWAVAHDEWDLLLRIVGPSWRVWLALGYPGEWREAVERALDEVNDPRLRLPGLATLAWLAFSDRDFDRAAAFGAERLELARSVADAGSAAGALTVLAAIAFEQQDYELARRYGEEAVALDREANEEEHLVAHLSNLSATLVEVGDLDATEAVVNELATLARSRGDDYQLAEVAFRKADVSLRRDDASGALRFLREAFAGRTAHDDRWSHLDTAGAALVASGRATEGVEVLAAAEAIRARRGDTRPAGLSAVRAGALARAREALTDDDFGAADDRGRQLDAPGAVAIVLATRAPRAARRSSTPGASRSSSSPARRARR